MKKIVLFLFILFMNIESYSQKEPLHHDSHLRSSHTIKFPWGIYFGLGSNSYYGDMSSFRHSFKSINYQFTIGLTYRLSKRVALGTSYRLLRLSASDAQSSSESKGRQKRNLSFVNMVHEFSLSGTLDLFNFDWKHTPDYSHATGFFPYLIGSVGFIYHNPKAELAGKYYDLKDMKTSKEKTEGTVKYNNLAAFISYGVGGKVKISSFVCLGVEATYTNTFSDYLDDLGSGTFYPVDNNSPEFLSSIDGKLADRSLESSLNKNRIADGGITKRSFDEQGARNDGYFTITVKADYAFQGFRNILNKNSSHFNRSKTPFDKR